MADKKKNEKVIIFFDDTVDIGKEPLPIKDSEHKKILEKLKEKYKIK